MNSVFFPAKFPQLIWKKYSAVPTVKIFKKQLHLS